MVVSLGRRIPPAFTLYSQTALLIKPTQTDHGKFALSVRPFQVALSNLHGGPTAPKIQDRLDPFRSPLLGGSHFAFSTWTY